MAKISELVGKTITRILGAEKDSSEIRFWCSDGTQYLMYSKDVNVDVWVEDICGNVKTLSGSQIIEAYKVTSDTPITNEYLGCNTWTFYNLSTLNGDVSIRWRSNPHGYCFDSVEFEQILS